MLNPELPQSVTLKDGTALTLRNPTPDDSEGLIDFVRGIDSESDFLNRFPGEFQVTVDQERSFLNNLNGL